jgi:hypothetical protein
MPGYKNTELRLGLSDSFKPGINPGEGALRINRDGTVTVSVADGAESSISGFAGGFDYVVGDVDGADFATITEAYNAKNAEGTLGQGLDIYVIGNATWGDMGTSSWGVPYFTIVIARNSQLKIDYTMTITGYGSVLEIYGENPRTSKLVINKGVVWSNALKPLYIHDCYLMSGYAMSSDKPVISITPAGILNIARANSEESNVSRIIIDGPDPGKMADPELWLNNVIAPLTVKVEYFWIEDIHGCSNLYMEAVNPYTFISYAPITGNSIYATNVSLDANNTSNLVY